MVVVKIVFIIFMVLYAMSKMLDGMNNRYVNIEDKIVNLVEIVIIILLTLIIFKF